MKRLRLVVLASSAWLVSCSQERPQPVAPPEETERSDLENLLDRVRANPKDADAWLRLAHVYEGMSQFPEQLDALQKVIALDPGMGAAYAKLGEACNRLGRYQEAVEALRRATKLIKDQPVLYNNLAVSYGKLGKTAEEIAALERAIALRPRYSAAHYNLGVARLRRGQRAEAMKELRILQDFDEGAAASLKKEIDATPSSR